MLWLGSSIPAASHPGAGGSCTKSPQEPNSSEGFLKKLSVQMCRTFRKPARAVLYGDERRHPWARMVVGKGCQVANVILEMHGDTLNDSALLFKASKDISAFSAELVWDMEAHVGGVCSQTPPRLHSLEPPTPAADSTADSKKKAEPAVEAQPADESAAKSPGVQASAVAAEGSATPQAEPTAKAEAAQQSDTRPDPDVIETKEADLSDQQKSKSATAPASKAIVIPAPTPTAANSDGRCLRPPRSALPGR